MTNSESMNQASQFEADDFRRRHLCEWKPESWVQIAHEAWEDYDSEAERREIPQAGKPPRMSRFGLPAHVHGFVVLFDHIAAEHFERAQEAGYVGTFAAWRQEVKRRGR